MSQAEIVARRRKWTPEEKAMLLAEVEAEGGRVSAVARRHGISSSLIYNWRAAWKAAASLRASSALELGIGVRVDLFEDVHSDPISPDEYAAGRGIGFLQRSDRLRRTFLPTCQAPGCRSRSNSSK
jgi:hypothetical protein